MANVTNQSIYRGTRINVVTETEQDLTKGDYPIQVEGICSLRMCIHPHSIRELKHATFLSQGRQPKVCCFPIKLDFALLHFYF